MNRPLIITIGIVILLSTVGLWVYLLAYGAPEKPREVFTNLGFLSPATNSEVRVIDPLAEENPGVQLSLGGAQLQQLTTRSVAGFAFVPDEPKIRYVERGTGHAYEIDLQSGTEIQISVTTIPQTAFAVFSPDAEKVAITSFEDDTTRTVVGTFSDDAEDLSLIALPEGIDNSVFADEDRMYFTYEEGGRTVGYQYNLETLTRSEVFQVAFADVQVLWGNTINGIYVYPRSAALLEGPVYEVTQNGLRPVAGGWGTTVFGEDNQLVISSVIDGVYTTHLYDADLTQTMQPLFMMPEKCVHDHAWQTLVWCGAPLERVTDAAYGAWQKGTATFVDNMWYTDLITGESIMAADLSELAGRTIDIHGIAINADSDLLIFSNKLDGALWLYRVVR